MFYWKTVHSNVPPGYYSKCHQTVILIISIFRLVSEDGALVVIELHQILLKKCNCFKCWTGYTDLYLVNISNIVILLKRSKDNFKLYYLKRKWIKFPHSLWTKKLTDLSWSRSLTKRYRTNKNNQNQIIQPYKLLQLM